MNQIVLGNSDNTIYCCGTVGIGTDTPLYALDVSGTARITRDVSINGILDVSGNIAIYNNNSLIFDNNVPLNFL